MRELSQRLAQTAITCLKHGSLANTIFNQIPIIYPFILYYIYIYLFIDSYLVRVPFHGPTLTYTYWTRQLNSLASLLQTAALLGIAARSLPCLWGSPLGSLSNSLSRSLFGILSGPHSVAWPAISSSR